MATNTAALAQEIADQATKIKDLAKLMDDAEGARTGSDSGVVIILRDISCLCTSWLCARNPSAS